MFKKVLVANRGEIACRLMQVLRERGIASVAVYSQIEAQAAHVQAADEAILLGPAPVSQSYLRADAIIAAAQECGAEAIHPGYGLLSENVDFARSCAEAGICFIGPQPETIEAMGDKAQAREAARRAGVPVVPGSSGYLEELEAAALAEALGYPILVKAAAGGGGIGMAVVKKPGRLARAIASCRDRGLSSFGSGEIYLEKYIQHPRHIEVQILFDRFGRGIHLFERECSLQRRHQKVIEEAPSPFISTRPALREELLKAALRLGESIGYEGAGTVEFIVDQAGSFYFIEINTRLQVEHPVSEAITGVGIIDWQLEIAAGNPLTLSQEEVQIQGAAIETRLYAEDPHRNFIPRPGRLERFELPKLEGIRLDSGVQAPQEISPYYDPMIAKLIAHGADRSQATARALGALEALQIEGLTTNQEFLKQILGEPAFVTGEFDTGWLAQLAKSL